MRAGDGWGVSALEPHIVHTSNDQQPGRPPRRRRESSALAQPSGHVNARTEVPVRNLLSGNGAASSSIEQEGSGTTSRGLGEEDGRAGMRGGDCAGLGAVETHPVLSSKEPETGRSARRSGRRENPCLPRSSHSTVDSTSSGRGEGLVRHGFLGNGAASSSTRVEPTARAQRTAAGVGTRDRSLKRQRGGAQSRLVGGDAKAMANGFHQSDIVLHKHGKNRVRTAAPSSEREDDPPGGSPRERLGEYFPPIIDELGLQCLTRLPRHRIYNMATVCRKWKEYLMSSDLYKFRLLSGVREAWVFILGNNMDKRWRVFQPSAGTVVAGNPTGSWKVVPPCPSDITFDMCDKESMVAGLNLLVLGQNADGYVIWKFDTIKSVWSTTPRMHSDRCMFGSATFGKYAYFAGGSKGSTVLKTVERYDSETNLWEELSEMNHDRKACSGFVMDGKFHVIGGHVLNKIVSSGEAYDPQTGIWTVIEGMWPQEFVPSTQVSPPLVAVLNNQLYAINITQNMLMLYNKEENVWQMLEKVPFRAENTNGWGLGFKAVGDELFVIGGATGPGQFLPKIHAYRPRADGGETWRHVTDLKIPTNGFIFNCAVMSG